MVTCYCSLREIDWALPVNEWVVWDSCGVGDLSQSPYRDPGYPKVFDVTVSHS